MGTDDAVTEVPGLGEAPGVGVVLIPVFGDGAAVTDGAVGGGTAADGAVPAAGLATAAPLCEAPAWSESPGLATLPRGVPPPAAAAEE